MRRPFQTISRSHNFAGVVVIVVYELSESPTIRKTFSEFVTRSPSAGNPSHLHLPFLAIEGDEPFPQRRDFIPAHPFERCDPCVPQCWSLAWAQEVPRQEGRVMWEVVAVGTAADARTASGQGQNLIL